MLFENVLMRFFFYRKNQIQDHQRWYKKEAECWNSFGNSWKI